MSLLADVVAECDRKAQVSEVLPLTGVPRVCMTVEHYRVLRAAALKASWWHRLQRVFCGVSGHSRHNICCYCGSERRLRRDWK